MKAFAEIAGALLRVALAAGFLWLCWSDYPVVQAREQFAAMPDYDYWKRAEELLDQERFSEALLVVDAGMEALPGQRAPLEALRERIEVERNNWMTRFQQVGRGALTGRGESAEALGGAIVADLFVFGDVRDLVIQAGNKLRGEAADPVIVALSAGGILLTVNPALDLGAALLKFARRIGAMTDSFAKNFLKTVERALKRQDADEVLQVTNDMATLSRNARPAGALAILRNVDDAAELRIAAQFSAHPEGAFTLWLGGRPALQWLKAGSDEALLLRAARKGRDGIEALVKNSALLLRAHPLTGLVKGFYKGNIPALLSEFLRSYALVLLGLAAGWLAYEASRLVSAVGRAALPASAP